MASASLRRQCARMLMVGFDGTTLPDATAALIDEGLFGAILFKRNITSPEATAQLCFALKQRAGRPFAMAVDQEGGRVARLRGAPFTALPPMRFIGKSLDVALARRVGALLAYEVRSLGFDWDFAPVLDIDTNPKNPVIGDRAFHSSPHEVARLGVALAQGIEGAGVASCAKHFPGHGDTSQDSHLHLPRLPHAMERLQQIELVPFRAYAANGLCSVMTAHVIFEAIDKKVPATMSPRVLQGLLREALKFDGVLVSDDLEMKAIADHFAIEEAIVAGAQAGVDLFLVCHHADVQRRALDALVKAVEKGTVSESHVVAANARLDKLAQRFVRPAEQLVQRLASAEHQRMAQGLEATAFAGVDPTEQHA
ncbi:MAG: beta-N-acetylhexosaminidase [Myxococcaceae bacterium]|nr:beta-N-acetylhexosaminidase [Myxococcaceae bacterium]